MFGKYKKLYQEALEEIKGYQESLVEKENYIAALQEESIALKKELDTICYEKECVCRKSDEPKKKPVKNKKPSTAKKSTNKKSTSKKKDDENTNK